MPIHRDHSGKAPQSYPLSGCSVHPERPLRGSSTPAASEPQKYALDASDTAVADTDTGFHHGFCQMLCLPRYFAILFDLTLCLVVTVLDSVLALGDTGRPAVVWDLTVGGHGRNSEYYCYYCYLVEEH